MLRENVMNSLWFSIQIVLTIIKGFVRKCTEPNEVGF